MMLSIWRPGLTVEQVGVKNNHNTIQGRIQAGSNGLHKPVKQFRFLKQNIKIDYQIPDYKKEFNFLM